MSTKLNRSHVVHGRRALIPPCLGRTEKDHQRKGIQSTSVEDSMSMVRLPLGFRIEQPARELVFLTDSGRAEFSSSALPDVVPAPGEPALGTLRSHDRWITTIHSDDDRYRDVKNLRTPVFMNRADMRERGIADMGPVDITSTARDGGHRHLNGCLAVPYDIPRGCAAGYMPEMNVLCAPDDRSTRSDRPIVKHVRVTVVPAGAPA